MAGAPKDEHPKGPVHLWLYIPGTGLAPYKLAFINAGWVGEWTNFTAWNLMD